MQFSDEQLAEVCWKYDMDHRHAQDIVLTREWLEHTYQNTFIAYGLIMPGEHPEHGEGIYVCVSTAASASQENLNIKSKVIIVPDFFYYDVFFHPGVALFNWAGITDGGFYLGTFESFLNEMCVVANIPDWRITY